MWVESITIENIKCFQHQEIKFIRNPKNERRWRAKPYNWITLLGENGVGKSTILQALALLLAGPEAAKELLPRPTGWVRDPKKPGKLTAVLHQEDGDMGTFGKDKRRQTFAYSYLVTGSEPVEIGSSKNRQTYTEPALVEEKTKILSWLRVNAFASDNQGWFAVGYGAFRRLTRLSNIIVPSIDPPKRSSNFFTQFNEDTALSFWLFGWWYAMNRVKRDKTLIEKDIRLFNLIICAFKRSNQLNSFSDKDYVDLCPPIEAYQVTKSQVSLKDGCFIWIIVSLKIRVTSKLKR